MSYLARPLTSRAIHLKIIPRPSNLGEQREILRLLSQFGEIDYYKSLKYDGQGLGRPDVGLVIFKDEEGAKNCFRGSPVRFRMGRVKAGEHGRAEAFGGGRREEQRELVEEKKDDGFGETVGPWGIQDATPAPAAAPKKGPFGLELETQHQRRYSSTSSLPSPNPRPLRMPFQTASPTQPENPTEDEGRIFHINTVPSRRNYRDMIDVSCYHGCFKIDGKQPGQPDLARKVPAAGLTCVDWRKEERPWKIVRLEREGWGVGERLGKIWQWGGGGGGRGVGGEGEQEANRMDRRGARDALGEVEGGTYKPLAGSGSGEGTEEGRKWGLSWSDVGIR